MPEESSIQEASLGSVRGVRCSVELTTTPWKLDIDTLVISTGGRILGRLGRKVEPFFMPEVWEKFDLRSVSTSRPGVVPILRPADEVPSLERVLCVTLHDEPDRDPSVHVAQRNIPEAVTAAF